MREHQLKRIDWFLSLERNKDNALRSDAIMQYKQELLDLEVSDFATLKKVAHKGDLLEEWQENLTELVKEIGELRG